MFDLSIVEYPSSSNHLFKVALSAIFISPIVVTLIISAVLLSEEIPSASTVLYDLAVPLISIASFDIAFPATPTVLQVPHNMCRFRNI